ncbi:MAG: homoserine O-succinyltransferase [Pseudomonadota bacterium]
MPLVAHSELPTFSYLQARGHDVLSVERASRQDIRELHIGFLNMMPDAALQATERQFIRLVGGCNRIAQFYVHPFSLPELDRGDEAQRYIDRYYRRFDELQEEGLDALIVTGANVANPRLPDQAFWGPLIQVAEWANENVTSILCSCLATHALLKHLHGIDRCPLPEKRWGVYEHRVCSDVHPLLREINTRFDAPHSRHNEITREQLEAAGLAVLVEDIDGAVHLAVSPDQFRVVYFQGHPEYDVVSLFKEYKRELLRHANGERQAPPPHPENYFSSDLLDSVARYAGAMALRPEADAADLEREIVSRLDNTWGDTAKAIMSNWLGLVYQLTNLDRREQFMSGVDRDDPLGSVSIK